MQMITLGCTGNPNPQEKDVWEDRCDMCVCSPGTFLAGKTQQISQQGAVQRVKGVEPKWDTAPENR